MATASQVPTTGNAATYPPRRPAASDREAHSGARPAPVPLRRRVCVLGEDLEGPPDEGIRKSALALAAALAGQHDVTVVSAVDDRPFAIGRQVSGASQVPNEPPRAGATVRPARAGRGFLHRELRAALSSCDPEVLVYVARTSTTFMTLLRCAALRVWCPRARLILIGMQRRHHARWQRALLRVLRRAAPDLICVQSVHSREYLKALGYRVTLLPSGIDTHLFRPAGDAERCRLRTKYGLEPSRSVALHVGHLRRGRGVGVLADLARRGTCQVVLVSSSTTGGEPAVAEELRAAGVHLLTGYLPAVHELYQLADCFVFPVESTDNAIEVPLSVLEAFACDLPVVSTRFGGLPQLFDTPDRPGGLVFADTGAGLVEQAERFCLAAPAVRGGTRVLALPYTWPAVADRLMAEVGGEMGNGMGGVPRGAAQHGSGEMAC